MLRSRARSLLVAPALSLLGCGGSKIAPAEPTEIDDKPSRGTAETSSWAEVTRSPWPTTTTPDAALTETCGPRDGALEIVARRLVDRRARGLGTPDPDDVASMLRTAGEPHPRPRILYASGRSDAPALRERLASLRTSRSRCGIARAPAPHGGELLVAVAVDALADLEPIPIRARVGQWLTFGAQLHVSASGARVVVMGPRGVPRTIPTSFDGATGVTRARFTPDRPGAFVVQLVGDVEGGPLPLLEARVFADVAPPEGESELGEANRAPGEDARGASDDATLAAMIDALRTTESLPGFLRHAELDRIARTHATKMVDARTVAHDLGEGDLRVRFDASGLVASAIGENVVHAATVAHAHRALHASPSHRMNLLRADFTHVGVAVARGADGSVYACEVFASGVER